MTGNHRPRRLATAALAAAVVLALAACSGDYPNTTFDPKTEFGRTIDDLWDTLLFWGTLVFIFVEALLVYVLIRYRRREGSPEPKHVHGNTTLEILWTVIPAVILFLIAVPTVKAIFKTQAKARTDALQVEVIGHQWWWEFRYPQFTTRLASGRLDTLTTANELYVPIGRTVNFHLRTADVLHSFWVPQLGGKRDLISNHTNFLWFTPDSTLQTTVWNGFCVEYCGASHANMRFRAFTVTAAEFDSWVQHQLKPAVFSATPAPAPGAAPVTAPPAPGPGTPAVRPAVPPPPVSTPPAVLASAAPAEGWVYPADRLPEYVKPTTPLPAGLRFDESLRGDPARGQQLYSRSACIGCHRIAGNPISVGIIGPNLTHFGSRHTLGAGLFPNDARHLSLWIKNARKMKPGNTMPVFGRGETDPSTGKPEPTGIMTDQEIADIVAYLLALK